MTDPALVVMSGVPVDLDGWERQFGARPGPRTATMVAVHLPADRVAAFVSALEADAPEGRIAVHRSPADAIGFSSTARVLQLAPPGSTLLTPEATPLFPDARPLPPARLPGSLRRVALAVRGTPHLLDGPRLPEPVDGISRGPDLHAVEELLGYGVRVVTVSGPPGVGKSHLLNDLAHRLATRGKRVVFLDATGHTPFGVLSFLGRELGIPLDGRLGPKRSLARLVSGIEHSSVDVIVADHLPEEAIPALRALVEHTAVQWIFGGLQRVGIASAVRYELQPLRNGPDADDAARLLARRAPDLGDHADAIAEQIDPTPLALEVVAGWSRDSHPTAIFEWVAAQPRSLHDLALRAFDALSDTTRDRLLRLVVWPDALGVDTDDPTIRGLLQRGWLQVRYDAAVPGLPAIRLHPRLRAVLLAHHDPPPPYYRELYTWMANQSEALLRMLRQRRAPAVFDLLAAWIPTLDAILTEILGSRPPSSENLALVAPILELRVACGARLGSVDPVLEGLERALQGAGARFDLDPVVVIRLFLARGEAFLHRREWDRAEADLERALALASRRHERAHQSRIELLLARVAAGRERPHRALEHLERSRTCAPPEDVLAGERASLRGIFLAQIGEAEEALRAFDEALPLVKGGAPESLATVLTERAVLLRQLERSDEAQRSYLQAIDSWHEAGQVERASAAMFQLALLLQSEGKLTEAERWLDDVEQHATYAGEDGRRGLVWIQRALIDMERGALSDALHALQEAISASRLGGDRTALGTARGFLALALHLQQEHERARSTYRTALRDLESGSDQRYGALFHCLLSAVEASLGNRDEATILLDLARLQLPDADPAMREALPLFEAWVEMAHARWEGTLSPTKVDEALAKLEEHRDNIYLRFARRYLKTMLSTNEGRP